MSLLGKAKRVRIYLSEDERLGPGAAADRVLALLREERAAGATVFRAVSGFGARGALHAAHLVEAARHLPVVVEWVDAPATVERLVPRLLQLLPHGLVTVEDTVIVHHAAPAVRELPLAMTAGDVMSRDVTRVSRDTPVREVVEAMLGRLYRAVPVVEGGVPVGMVTNSDLVRRGGLGVRLDLLRSLDKPELRDLLERLSASHLTAADVMTPTPATVHLSTPLPDVAGVMTRRKLKRLPVVDDAGRLVGIVSRLDLLRTAAGAAGEHPALPRALGLAAGARLSAVVRRDVPLVHPATPLAEVLQAVVATRLNRALVVDDERRVVGLVTDAELLERMAPSERPGALQALMSRLPFAQPRTAAAAPPAARTAAELMSPHVAVAREDVPVPEAIEIMLRGNHKVLAVTDEAGRLVGVVDRADLLHGLLP